MNRFLNTNFGYLIIGLFIVLMHLPFINADPSLLHSTGRGAFTDEGLYTAQARSFIHQKTWDLNNSDALVKTPLFGFSILIPYFLFGTKLYVARLWVLLISVFLFLFICKKYHHHLLALVSLPLVFFHFYIFQYLHFSLAEMLSTVCIAASLIIANEGILIRNKKLLFLAIGLLCMSWFFKIQYLYTLAIVPLYLAYLYLTNKLLRKIYGSLLIRCIAYSLLFMAIYWLVWYWPNKGLFNYVMEEQSKAKFLEITEWHLRAKALFLFYFWDTYTWIWTLLITFIFAFTLINLKKFKQSKYLHLFGLVFIWVLIESYKLTLLYAPSRYFIALFFAMGFLASICLCFFANKIKFKYFIISVLSIVCVVDFAGYKQLYETRTYSIVILDNYLANSRLVNKVMLGTWAAAVNWQSNARALPIWDEYFNYNQPLNHYKPSMLILEENQSDCNELFIRNKIDLISISDSVISYQIGNWQLRLYWLKQ